jgi:hypothetical protein
MTLSTGSKQECSIAKARKKPANHRSLASTTIFIFTIFLKPRAKEFFGKSSGQSMGVLKW